MDEHAVRPPTLREHKLLTLRVRELEAELADAVRGRTEPLRPHQPVHRHTNSTREAIKRDKANRGKRLDPLVEAMAPEERDVLLRDVCRTLAVTTPHAVRDALANLTAAASALPAMQAFIGSILQILERDRQARCATPLLSLTQRLHPLPLGLQLTYTTGVHTLSHLRANAGTPTPAAVHRGEVGSTSPRRSRDARPGVSSLLPVTCY